MVRLSSCFFVVVLVLLSIRETSSQLGSGPHITDVNILLPPRMKNPVEHRLQGSDGCFKCYVSSLWLGMTDDIKLYGEETDYWKIVSVPDDLSSEYGWRNSRILKAISPGLGELTAALTYFNGHQNSKEVLKVVQDIVVCEKVQFTLNSEDDTPKILLPWTPAVYQEMELIVTGGCAKASSDYKWFTSDVSILSVSAYGIIQAKRPGIATVKVVSTFDSQNFDEVIVEVSIPSSMVMLQYFPVETVVGSHLQAAVTMKALNGYG
ncbi:hypothetical protein F2Q70_00043684 [Brassica cretica]|uniref:BIG2 domain-containing protein n=1 Tax=Brassica cretica TaxID=69181 RepID=A0A8S9KN12_BRACR|nr:hypothetical protein F2Q70_00043684 [Brassica cretica]